MWCWIPLALFFLVPPGSWPAISTPAIPELEYDSHPFRPARPPGDNEAGLPVGVAIAPGDRVFVVASPSHRVLVWERRQQPVQDYGRYVGSLTTGLTMHAHALRIDIDQNLWIVDDERGALFEFDRHAQPKMQTSDGALKEPLDVAFDAAGDVFVLERTRLVKLDSTGLVLTSVSGFKAAHSMVVDAGGNVYVADGGRARIDVFDNALSRRATFDHAGVPWALCITETDPPVIFSASNPSASDPLPPDAVSEVYELRLDGTIVGKFGRPDNAFGNYRTIHQMVCHDEHEIVAVGAAGVQIVAIHARR